MDIISGNVTVTRPKFSRRQFRLTENIPNPKLDRRRKSGPYSMPVFPKGLVVDVEEMSQHVTRDGVTTEHTHKNYQIGHEQVPEAVRSSFEAQDPGTDLVPENLEEAAKSRRVSVDTLCEYALRELVKEGMSIERILELYDRSEEES